MSGQEWATMEQPFSIWQPFCFTFVTASLYFFIWIETLVSNIFRQIVHVYTAWIKQQGKNAQGKIYKMYF